MAEPWEVEVGGQVYEVEADTPQQAAVLARLMAAREQGVAQAEAGAMQRGAPSSAAALGPSDPGFYGDPNDVRNIVEAGKHSGTAKAAGPTAAILGTAPLVAGALAAPGVTAASLGAGYLGSEIGERGGRKLEEYGAPGGTSKALGLAGGLAGGIYGGIKGQALLKDLLKTGIGRGSMLGQILERAAGTEAAAGGVVAKETTEEAAKRAALALQKQEAEIASIRAASDKARAEAARVAAKQAQDAERHELQKQILQRRLEGKAPLAPRVRSTKPIPKPSAAEPEMLPDDAVSVIPESGRVPYDQKAVAGDVATIAEQIQQKSGMLRPTEAGMVGGKKMVAEELAKLPPATRAQVEDILARGQAKPATIYQPTPGTARPVPYKGSAKPLKDPLLELARQEGSKPGRVWGEKIYLELDEAGKPVRVLSGSGAATALQRKGIKTTWVKNLWGQVHDAKSAKYANAD